MATSVWPRFLAHPLCQTGVHVKTCEMPSEEYCMLLTACWLALHADHLVKAKFFHYLLGCMNLRCDEYPLAFCPKYFDGRCTTYWRVHGGFVRMLSVKHQI